MSEAVITAKGGRQPADAPRVSVAIASYNHAAYVSGAIDSVLAQTFQDFEIIITDDGSRDGTVEVLRSYAQENPRIKLFLNRYNYETHATNHCIQQSVGEYIAVLSSDDEFHPAKLEQQVEFLDRHPHVAAVFTEARIIDERDADYPDPSHFYCRIFKQPNRSRHEWLRRFFFEGNSLCHPSVLIRRSVYDTLGLYNPLMGAIDDLDMWVRICLHYEIHILPYRLVNFRVRDNLANVSADTPENSRRVSYEMIKILEHFQSSVALAQMPLIFPELGDEVRHESDAGRRHALALAALKTGGPSHRFWAIDLLYRLLSDPGTKRQLRHRIGTAPDVDFIKMNGALNPLAEYRVSAQVFWPNGEVLTEVDSSSRFVQRSIWNDLRFPLPRWDQTHPLRFDPCDSAGVVKISSLNILSQIDGQCVWSCPLERRDDGVVLSGSALWLSDRSTATILSTGSDPQLYLTGIPPLPDLPLELQAWVKFEPDLSSVTEEIRAMQAGATKLDRESKTLKVEVTSLADQNEALRTNVTVREAAIEELKTAIAKLGRDCEALKVEVANLTDQNEALRANVTVREAAIEELKTTIDALGTECGNVNAQNELLKTAVAEAERVTLLVLNSASWRVTRPLRWLKDLLRAVRPRRPMNRRG
jgi:hypothetical protein